MLTVIESNDASFQQHWHTLLDNDPLQNPLYKSQVARKQRRKVTEDNYSDRSFVVVAQNKPVFGCSLTVHTDEQGNKRLGYFGLDAYTHVNSKSLSRPSNNFSPEAIRLLQQHIFQLLAEEQPATVDYLDPVSCGIMSPMTEVLLQQGARPTVHKVQVVDLTKTSDLLLGAVSPAYRSILTWGQENLDVSVIYSDSGMLEFDTDELKSKQSPDTQEYLENCVELLKHGQGFLVQADQDNELAGSALCVHSERTCQLVIGESFQAQSEHPVLPVLVWRAIQEAKAIGCSQFDFGILPTQGEITPQQFGGVTHTRLKISL